MDRDGALTGEQLDRLSLHQIRPVVRVVPQTSTQKSISSSGCSLGFPIADGDLSQLIPPLGEQLHHAAH